MYLGLSANTQISKKTSINTIDTLKEVKTKQADGRRTNRKNSLIHEIMDEAVYFLNYCDMEKKDRDLTEYARNQLTRT